jgi:hypothetical protein
LLRWLNSTIRNLAELWLLCRCTRWMDWWCWLVGITQCPARVCNPHLLPKLRRTYSLRGRTMEADRRQWTRHDVRNPYRLQARFNTCTLHARVIKSRNIPGRESSVLWLRYELDDRGSIPGMARCFSCHNVHTDSWGPPGLLYPMGTGILFLGGKATSTWSWPPSTAEVKNAWSFPPFLHTPAWHGAWLSTRDNFAFIFTAELWHVQELGNGSNRSKLYLR